MVKGILEHAGYKVGLIGTIETIIGDTHIPSSNTTPESYLVQKYFAQMDARAVQEIIEKALEGYLGKEATGV